MRHRWAASELVHQRVLSGNSSAVLVGDVRKVRSRSRRIPGLVNHESPQRGKVVGYGRARTGVDRYRRVVVPSLLSSLAWLAPTGFGLLGRTAARHDIEAILAGRHSFPITLLVPPLAWAAFPVIFLAIYLCNSRGGARRECMLVACVPFVLSLLGFLARAAMVATDQMSLGIIGPKLYLGGHAWGVVGYGATCWAAFWLYFLAARPPGERQAPLDTNRTDDGPREMPG